MIMHNSDSFFFLKNLFPHFYWLMQINRWDNMEKIKKRPPPPGIRVKMTEWHIYELIIIFNSDANLKVDEKLYNLRPPGIKPPLLYHWATCDRMEIILEIFSLLIPRKSIPSQHMCCKYSEYTLNSKSLSSFIRNHPFHQHAKDRNYLGLVNLGYRVFFRVWMSFIIGDVSPRGIFNVNLDSYRFLYLYRVWFLNVFFSLLFWC